jgi:general secretion pathway protein N
MAAAPGLQRPDSARISADCCTTAPLQLRAALRLGRRAHRGGRWPCRMWPAALLAGLGTPWNTLQLDGDLGLVHRAFQ